GRCTWPRPAPRPCGGWIWSRGSRRSYPDRRDRNPRAREERPPGSCRSGVARWRGHARTDPGRTDEEQHMADGTGPAPLHLVLGEDEFLAARATSAVVAAVRAATPAGEEPPVVSRLGGPDVTAPQLLELLSPSLFGSRPGRGGAARRLPPRLARRDGPATPRVALALAVRRGPHRGGHRRGGTGQGRAVGGTRFGPGPARADRPGGPAHRRRAGQGAR